jgi:hypothetical protein
VRESKCTEAKVPESSRGHVESKGSIVVCRSGEDIWEGRWDIKERKGEGEMTGALVCYLENYHQF